MAAVDIHHVTLNTADLEASVAFYNEIVGAKTVHRPDLGYPGAWLQLGSTMFHFNGGDMAKSRDGTIHRGGGAVDHVALRAHDFDKTLKMLESKGFDYRQNVIPDAGLWQLFVHDPNGVLIEFNFPIDEEPKGAKGPSEGRRFVPNQF